MSQQEEFSEKANAMQKRITDALIPVMRKAAVCNVACFDAHSDMSLIEKCAEKCAQPGVQANDFISMESQSLQKSVEGCIQSCSSKFNPRFVAAGGDAREKGLVEKEAEVAVMQCFKDGMSLLGPMESRILQKAKELSK